MIACITLNVSIDRRYVVPENRTGAVNRVRECVCTAGGKGLNVARIVRALGEPVVAGGIAGGDSGRYILRRLDEEGIAHHFTRIDAESRSCINVYDEAADTQTEYLEPGPAVSEEDQAAFLRDFDALIEPAAFVTISGSLPRGVPPDFYARLIARARRGGKRVLLDTSGEPLRLALEAKPYYIKPNEDEIAAFAGGDIGSDAQLAQAARHIHQGGVERVVISRGGRGALMAYPGGVVCARPPLVKARNTVGCGDSMTAAFAVAAVRGMEAGEAMRFAVAVSAASALHAGTGGFLQSDFDQIMPNVAVFRV